MKTLIGEQFPVLGGSGFIRVVDWMGNDSAIVQAARISYGEGTKTVNEDRGLIRYLMRHRHTTPFEMCEIKLHLRMPMDVARQWIRHRTANVNEYSTRYSVAIDEALRTSPGEWRSQGGPGNKQGSGETLPSGSQSLCEIHYHLMPDGRCSCFGPGDVLSRREGELHQLAREVYQERLQAGVAREQARKDLPLSTFTEMYWKIDLHNLLHFLELRMDAHAQLEIRSYAKIIGEEIVAEWCPLVWEAFKDYRLNAIMLSGLEVSALRHWNDGDTGSSFEGLSKRELEELKVKASKIGCDL